jgi:hypothetical protein
VAEHDPAARVHGAAVRVTASITRENGRYRLQLRVHDGDTVAERTVGGDDCGALADAAALLIALAIARGDDPDGAPTSTSAAGARAAGSTAPSERTPTATQARAPIEGAPATSKRRAEPLRSNPRRTGSIAISPDNEVFDRPGAAPPFRIALGAALALDAGMLPRAPALGVEPSLQLRAGWFGAELALGLWLARTGDSERYAAAELRGSGAIGKLALGADLMQAPLVIGPRGVIEFGRLAVETRRVSEPRPGSATWFAAGAALHLGYPIARQLELTLDVGVLFPLARPRWLLHTPRGAIDLFTAAPAALRASAGLAYVLR